ncbi:MAG TPA: hypothetical protein VHE10_03910, partial [Candidatus Paceibacterota bacterium]|nr:hypothetical protein [Candidatus Paceibacterota bacterium]
MNPDFQKPQGSDGNWLSMSEAASFTPYSAEYLSLLARKKKLAAKKIGKTWYTTKAILDEYMKRQMIRNQIQHGDLSAVTAVQAAPAQPAPVTLAATPIQSVPAAPGMIVFNKAASGDHPHTSRVRTFHGDLKNYLNGLNAQEKKIGLAETPRPVIKVPVIAPQPIAPAPLPKTDPDPIAATLAEISKKLDKVRVLPGQPNIVTRSWRTIFGSKTLIYATVAVIVFFSIFPTPFVFGFFDGAVAAAKKAWTDANTVMGFRPGTHQNEILLLDKEGNVSIMGHIETDGQFRSYAKDGIAPIVVDSKTLVKNLNAEMLDGSKSGDFTLAFVTKNGNVTTDDVYLDGNVEVGKTLLVKGATRLLSAVEIDGGLSVFGDAKFAKSITVDGPAFFNAVLNASNIHSTGVASLGEVITTGNVAVGKNVRVRGSAEVSRDLVVAGTGSFGSAGVSGDFSAEGEIALGNPSDTITIDASNAALDEEGNLSVDGRIVAGNISVSNANIGDAVISALASTVANIATLAAQSVGVDALTATDTIAVNATTTNATTTNLVVSGSLALSGVPSCSGGAQALQTNASGVVTCGMIIGGGGSGSDGVWFNGGFGDVHLSTSTDRVAVGASSTPYAKLSVLSGSTGTTTLALAAALGQTANILDIYNSSGALSTIVTASGNLKVPQATTTNLAITSVTGALLKTDGQGNVIGAIPGIDYPTIAQLWSTTSTDYYKSVNNFWSTTSASYWDSTIPRWSTTSSDY